MLCGITRARKSRMVVEDKIDEAAKIQASDSDIIELLIANEDV